MTYRCSEYPLYVVTYWIGNTARIAAKHYLQIPDEVYEKAAQKAAHEAQKQAQHTAAMGCMGLHENPQESPSNGDLAVIGAETGSAPNGPMEAGGFEPPSRDVSG
ncbi:MAG: hypothetical protein ABFD90_10820 [Phycisphaerales bacterium]